MEHVERAGGKEWGERGELETEKEQERIKRARRGASSPFYSESGTPGCCQVTVRWSLEEILTDPILENPC